MRALVFRSLAPLGLCLLLAPPVYGVGPNRIREVRLSHQSGTAVVEIAGERAPNFTSFKQDNPRRIIVDVAESDLENVPDLIRGDGGLVNEISTRRFGRPPHSVSRVVIGLSREAEYRVTSRGGTLFVHVMPGAGGLLVSAGVPLAPELPPPPPVDDAPPSAPATPPVNPNVSPAAARGAGPQAAVAPSAAAPAPAPIVPKTTYGESEPVRVAMAESPAAPPAPPAEPARAAPVPGTAYSSAAVSGPAPRPQPVRVAQADDSSEPPPEVEEVTEEPPPPPPPEEQTEDAVPPPPPPAAEEAAPPPPPPPAAEEAAPPPPPPEPVREEAPVPPPPPAKPSPAEERPIQPEARVEVTSAMKDMTWLGFQQTAEASRVFIKTNEPVRYRVVEEGDDLVVLELENTRIPLRNNRRFLDTHFFNTAVTMITPREIEGVSRNVRVEIQLRHKVPYSATQEDNVVYLRFERPR